MKIIHTSDWHLGHQLMGIEREYEHDCFLDWLLDTLDEEDADALIIAGDIFDHANPSSKAQSQLYGFLARLMTRRPDHFQTLIIGGNHDSAIRLEAPNPLLKEMRVRVIGGMTAAEMSGNWDRLLAPLYNNVGEIAAWCAAMPYLRLADLPPVDGEGDSLIAGVRARYDALFDALRERAESHQALLATGHLHMVGGAISELSERRILGGHEHALPVSLFPDDLAYVALGHLHKAQKVGGREGVRYSGSPMPLSFGEHAYKHQILSLELDGASLKEVQTLAVPRFVDMIRLPAAAVDETVEALQALYDFEEGMGEYERPYLEVTVRLTEPEPGLRRRLDEALEGKAARLLKVGIEYTGSKESLGDAVGAESLHELTPEDVFERCYGKTYESEPDESMRAAFAELLDGLEVSE